MHTTLPRPARVLVVDDNRDAADMLSLLLASLGVETAVAHDGRDGLRLAAQIQPHLVFLDLGMPGMDGFEAARAMRSLPGMARSLIVALSGWGDELTRARTAAHGFDLHLTKPASLESITHALHRAGPR